MRQTYTDYSVNIDGQKYAAFNNLRATFSKALLKRFYEIKDVIEDVFDLANTQAVLEGRLKVLAAKEVYTAKNLIDIALISCVLWNGVDDVDANDVPGNG